MKTQLQKVFLVLAALLASFAAYAMVSESVPHMIGDLVEIGVRPTLLSAVSRTMNFAGWSMVAFAGILICSAFCVVRNIRVGRIPLIVIGVLYSVAGGVAVTRNPSIHMYGYVMIGILSLVAGLL
jgi:hypothetical protein